MQRDALVLLVASWLVASCSDVPDAGLLDGGGALKGDARTEELPDAAGPVDGPVGGDAADAQDMADPADLVALRDMAARRDAFGRQDASAPQDAFVPFAEYFGAEPTAGSGKDERGQPIGGGAGYAKIVSLTNPKIRSRPTTASALVSALQSATSGDVVFIAGSTTIDLSGIQLHLPAGVVLASDRGLNGSAGARLTQTGSQSASGPNGKPCLIVVDGVGARVSGLRIQGPQTEINSSGAERTAICSTRKQLEIDNCEISGWANAGIELRGTSDSDMQKGGWVHHNFIHHCQKNGLGYGVVASANAVALIESNRFDYGRHAVASDGEPGSGYEVRYNIFGRNYLASNTAHQVDVHGKQYSGYISGWNWVAGTKQLIHHNTFQTSASNEQFCIAIQAVPITGAWINHNWFYWTRSPPVWQQRTPSAGYHITMERNRIGNPGSIVAGASIRLF